LQKLFRFLKRSSSGSVLLLSPLPLPRLISSINIDRAVFSLLFFLFLSIEGTKLAPPSFPLRRQQMLLLLIHFDKLRRVFFFFPKSNIPLLSLGDKMLSRDKSFPKKNGPSPFPVYILQAEEWPRLFPFFLSPFKIGASLYVNGAHSPMDNDCLCLSFFSPLVINKGASSFSK